MADWYDQAKQEFLIDLAVANDVSLTDAKQIYSYLVNVGLVDYDIEKEFLWDEYVPDEEKT